MPSSGSPVPRRARAKGRDDAGRSRTRILDAAQNLFAERGFDATPTAKVAAQAGVPNGLVFYYFPTKIDLLLALVRERALVEQMLPEPGDLVAGDLAASLMHLGRRILDHLDERRELTAIIFQELPRHVEVRERVLELRQEAARRVACALERVAAGEMTETDDEETEPAEEFLAAAQLFNAALLLASALGRSPALEFDLRAAATALTDGLSAGVRPGKK
jgi:AcrR family transcriptional regulator